MVCNMSSLSSIVSYRDMIIIFLHHNKYTKFNILIYTHIYVVHCVISALYVTML